ncbi:MAG: SRPBCC domain-containing protein [Chloroflexota bacterium]
MVTLAAPAQTNIAVTQTIHAPIAQVYSAFTERDPLKKWLCDDADVRAAVGGHILLTWQGGAHVNGVFTALEKNEQVAFTWRSANDNHETVVDVHLTAQGDGTQVELSHSGFAPDADLDTIQREWENRLNVLQMALENGEDIRITHRVIIGIVPADFNADIAARLGVPTAQGVRVGSLIPNFSAAAAGLLSDDVIIGVNGRDITDQMPIGVLVRDNKPGDVVDVSYYRGSEKHTIPVALKGYPVPDQVTTFAALADRLGAAYAEIDSTLSGLFAAASEADAAHKTAPKEWSANEVMAHLIMSERWQHNALGCMMDMPEVEGWSCNHVARIAAVTTAYPTSADLLAELRRCHAETVAVVRHIPDEVGERKTVLWQMNFQVDGMNIHTRQHFDQIRAALAAAKA